MTARRTLPGLTDGAPLARVPQEISGLVAAQGFGPHPALAPVLRW